MKRITLITLGSCWLVVGLAHGGPHPNFAVQANARATATNLFRSGNSAAAVLQLAASVRPDVALNQRDQALVELLAEMAAECYNRRDLALGRAVANEAFMRAAPLFAANELATRPQRANLASTLGLLKEELFHDWAGAESYYAAALNLDPGNKIVTVRQQALRERQKAKNRSTGGR